EPIAPALRPSQRPLHRLARRVELRGIRETLVEHHGDVGSEPRLNVDDALRTEEMRRAVEMRAKACAVFVDRPARGEAEHLIAAAVGEDRPIPGHEAMKSAPTRDQFVAGPQIKVVRVAEENLRSEVVEITVRDRLD